MEPGRRAGEVVLSGPPVGDAGAGETLTVTATPLAGGRELAVTVAGETLALPLSAEGERIARGQDSGGGAGPRSPARSSASSKRGGSVEEGDVVAVIESMKMHWEIRAPAGGALEGVAVERGQAVAAGALLLRVAAPTG